MVIQRIFYIRVIPFGAIMPAVFIILSIGLSFSNLIHSTIYMPIQFVLFLLTAPFDKNRRIMHYNTSLLCVTVLFLSPVLRLKFSGRENLDRSKGHVVVMNHQSLLDILLVFTLFYPAKMIAKKALTFVPVVGWNLFLSGHLFVDRSKVKSQFDAIRKMDNLLVSGDSLMIYPEGTRTRNGDIAEYKKGAFRSACNTGTPVQPVVIDGAYQALPRKRKIFNGFYTITLSVLPPVPVEKGSPTKALAALCHELMSLELKRLRTV